MSDYNLKKSLGFKLDKASRLTTLNFNKKFMVNLDYLFRSSYMSV